MTSSRGTLFLVVGPSGAGKDSLIDGAKAALGGNAQYVFPRRYITRPIDAGGENHIPLSEEAFDSMHERGGMVLSWQAHKLHYGVPATVTQHLDHGRHVIVNVSRTVLDEARERFAPVKVLSISVDPEVLAQRLKARGRENAADIKRRVQRAGDFEIKGADVIDIDNGGDLDSSVAKFIDAITAAD